jgi:D-amino-acid dehydrogenase
LKNVVVIGGGIIGLSSAFYLQQSGHRVTVIDKGDFSDNCSYGNAGYVCPSHFIPLATPGIVWKGLKWMLNSRSPFYVRPSLNRSLVDWGLKFIKSATNKKVEAAAIPLTDIAKLSQHEYEEWSTLPGFDFSYEQKGLFEIFQTHRVAAHAAETMRKAKELGLDVALLSYEELQKMEPQTKINALGAIFFKSDAHLYPNKLMKDLLAYLRWNGVQLITNEEVKGFEKDGKKIAKVITSKNIYDAEEVVIATGAWSRDVTAMVNTKIPMMPGRGYSLTLENSGYHLNHPAILVEGRVAVTPMDKNKIRFGGTMEVVPVTAPPRYHRMEGILQSVKRFFPEFNIAMPSHDKLWYGYRPCSADGLPYIGRIKSYDNVIVATGHSMLGLSLGAGTGKLVSELINEKSPSINIAPFAVERFDK